MSEREIRETVRAVMAELDRRAKNVGRGVRKVMIPAAMGTALAMSSGCDSGREVSTGDASIEMQVPGADAAYMAPDVAIYMGPDLQADIGMPDMAYGVPDAPVYMGPDVGADLGPSPDAAYMAPDLMSDTSPAYIAPEAGVIAEAGTLYMGPDAAADDLGVGPQPLYMAADPPPEKP